LGKHKTCKVRRDLEQLSSLTTIISGTGGAIDKR